MHVWVHYFAVAVQVKATVTLRQCLNHEGFVNGKHALTKTWKILCFIWALLISLLNWHSLGTAAEYLLTNSKLSKGHLFHIWYVSNVDTFSTTLMVDACTFLMVHLCCWPFLSSFVVTKIVFVSSDWQFAHFTTSLIWCVNNVIGEVNSRENSFIFNLSLRSIAWIEATELTH